LDAVALQQFGRCTDIIKAAGNSGKFCAVAEVLESTSEKSKI